MIKILFICHGNICRSPMAEFIMKKLVDIKGNDYTGRYVMSNFLTVKYGLSEKCSVEDISPELQWKDVPYSSYFTNAFEYAKRQGFGLFGEKDPYWDYEKNEYNNKKIEGIDYF